MDFTRYSLSQDFNSTITGLSRLRIDDLDFHGGGQWPFKLIANSCKTLKHLYLGVESQISKQYATRILPKHCQLPQSFADTTRKAVSSEDQRSVSSLRLETLHLCGLELSRTLQGAIGLELDFQKLSMLSLQSCPGLPTALPLLVSDHHSAEGFKLPKLNALFISCERDLSPIPFTNILEQFLRSLPGLTRLEVLVDKARGRQPLGPILDIHGKTLNCLLWEERYCSRMRVNGDASMVREHVRNLKVVSQKCPELTALALPVDWKAISESDKYHPRASSHFDPSKPEVDVHLDSQSL